MTKQKLFLEKESYVIRGAAINTRKNLGSGQKEIVYKNDFAEELNYREVSFSREKPICIYSVRTGKKIGTYIPDFIIINKIIVEAKATQTVSKRDIDQLYYYLRNSRYELGFLINFGGERLYIKRIIYTNENKPWYKRKNETK